MARRARAASVTLRRGRSTARASPERPSRRREARSTSLAAARQILDEVDHELFELAVEGQRAAWVFETFIGPDTESLTSKAEARVTRATVDLAKRAARIAPARLPEGTARQLGLLRTSLPLLAPSETGASEELARLVASMRGRYATGSYRPEGATAPMDLGAISRRLGESRDPRELADLWTGWHAVGRPMREEFTRYVELSNRGAREVGFEDTGAMWRSRYEMSPAELDREVERLWSAVRPLYELLHAYVRHRLGEFYSSDLVPPDGPIPSQLLGNMWAQSWELLHPLLRPPSSPPTYDLTQLLSARQVDPRELVRYAERFFLSLGFDPLPPTFWERSLFVKPADREVLCHASAWDIDFADDLRIKMCIDVTGEEFAVVHHELGHNFYQRAYKAQPFLFRDSAHDGFHEAVGDTIGLSVTPDYLARIGLLPSPPPADTDVDLLLRRALEKVAFLPFGLLIDRWRWKVFAGEIGPESYTTSWHEMRRRYQGVAPPLERTEADFDPGAKAHVPSSVPYLRYFLAQFLQFDFHRAFARNAGWSGPLHRFSIYGDAEAGRRLRTMFEMGASRPWPEALEVVTGRREVDPTALLDYFAPLTRWLERETHGLPRGWRAA